MSIPNPAYYFDDYADEVAPSCLTELTLAGWAAWLAQGGEKVEEGEEAGCWTFDPPEDGKTFKANRLDFAEDIRVERFPDDEGPVIELSRDDLADYDFAAIRFAPGFGWDADSILDPSGRLIDQLCDPDCPLVEVGDEEVIAVAKSTDLVLVYRTDPPRLEEVSVQ